MIPHDHIRMDPPAESLARLAQSGLERLRRPRALEHIPPVIPAIDHMINRPRKLNPQPSRHLATSKPHLQTHQPKINKYQPDPIGRTIESFWSSLKYETVYHRRFATRAEARTAIFDYIEVFYNRTRLHSSLGYVSPATFESHHNKPKSP